MTDESREQLGNSLFRSTSAFVQPEQPYPADPAPIEQRLSSAPQEDWAELVALLEDVLDLVTDEALVPPLEEALELARKHA